VQQVVPFQKSGEHLAKRTCHVLVVNTEHVFVQTLLLKIFKAALCPLSCSAAQTIQVVSRTVPCNDFALSCLAIEPVRPL
jgi:hypothetical protein